MGLKKPGKRSLYLLCECESSSTKTMANKPQILDSNFATALKAKLICQDCQRNPRPNIPLYICQICQIYKCETCQKIKSGCTKGHTTYLEPTLTMITSTFTDHLCIMSKNGCGEELDVKKLEDHEKYCPFQNVPCPVISCTQSIVFKDTQKHLDETHKCLKVDDEWEFEGTQEELVQDVCCLSSYGQQFFVQFQMNEKKCGFCSYHNRYRSYCFKDNRILLSIFMLGHQDEVHSFQA